MIVDSLSEINELRKIRSETIATAKRLLESDAVDICACKHDHGGYCFTKRVALTDAVRDMIISDAIMTVSKIDDELEAQGLGRPESVTRETFQTAERMKAVA